VHEVTVRFATADGTAVADEGDYTIPDNTLPLTFTEGGPVIQTVFVPVLDDVVSEPHETITLTLSDATNARILDGEAVGTIENDDAVIRFDDDSLLVSIDEGDAGSDTSFTFTLTLDNPNAAAVTVDYATGDGTATAPDDYDAAAGTVTFAAGQTEAGFAVIVHGDDVIEPDTIEPDETFTVTLTNATAGATIGTAQATGEIFDDDAPRLSVDDVSVVEGAPIVSIYGVTQIEDLGDFVFTLSLSQAQSEPVTVAFEVKDGTATLGEDFHAPAETQVTFPAGQTKAAITVAVVPDADIETPENFRVHLGEVTGNAVVGQAVATGLILNDDVTNSTLSVSAFDVSWPEGDAADKHLPIVVRLSQEPTVAVTVDYQVIDGSAIGGVDYAALAPGTLTFEPGEIVKTIHVPVFADTAVESNRIFTVQLSNPTGGARLGDATARGMIIDDDAAAAYLQFTVSLDKPSDVGDVTVHYTTAIDDGSADEDDTEAADDGDGSNDETADPLAAATPDVDFVTTASTPDGPLTFTFGDDDVLTRTVRVPIIGDFEPEDTETLLLVLSDAVNAKIFDDRAVGTITNDDTYISFDPDSLTVEAPEGDTGAASITFDVVLSDETVSTPTVRYITSHGTTNDDDYSVVAEPGKPVAFTFIDEDEDGEGEYRATITIPLKPDTAIESDEDHSR